MPIKTRLTETKFARRQQNCALHREFAMLAVSAARVSRPEAEGPGSRSSSVQGKMWVSTTFQFAELESQW
jgi:hypothetical protein